MKKLVIGMMSLLVIVFVGSVTAFAQVSDGLVAYYPFNGNANDETGNGNHGIVNGAKLTEDRFGNPNSAYEFDGSPEAVIDCGNHESLQAQDVTVNCWIYPYDLETRKKSPTIINKAIKKGEGYVLFTHGNKLFTEPSHMGEFETLRVEEDLTREWHMATVTYDSVTQTTKIYLNGEPKDSKVFEMAKPINKNLTIGNGYNTQGLWATAGFQGLIDDVRIYNRALSDAEIRELYGENPSPPIPPDDDPHIPSEKVLLWTVEGNSSLIPRGQDFYLGFDLQEIPAPHSYLFLDFRGDNFLAPYFITVSGLTEFEDSTFPIPFATSLYDTDRFLLMSSSYILDELLGHGDADTLSISYESRTPGDLGIAAYLGDPNDKTRIPGTEDTIWFHAGRPEEPGETDEPTQEPEETQEPDEVVVEIEGTWVLNATVTQSDSRGSFCFPPEKGKTLEVKCIISLNDNIATIEIQDASGNIIQELSFTGTLEGNILTLNHRDEEKKGSCLYERNVQGQWTFSENYEVEGWLDLEYEDKDCNCSYWYAKFQISGSKASQTDS